MSAGEQITVEILLIKQGTAKPSVLFFETTRGQRVVPVFSPLSTASMEYSRFVQARLGKGQSVGRALFAETNEHDLKQSLAKAVPSPFSLMFEGSHEAQVFAQQERFEIKWAAAS